MNKCLSRKTCKSTVPSTSIKKNATIWCYKLRNIYFPLIINPCFPLGFECHDQEHLLGPERLSNPRSRACVALAEVLGLVSSTDRAAQTIYNSSPWDPDAFSALLSTAHALGTQTCTWAIYTWNKNALFLGEYLLTPPALPWLHL